jgi:hypothetical protein
MEQNQTEGTTETVEVPRAKLYAPEGMTSCSHAGQTYEVGEDGTVAVPHEAVPHLQAHGLSTSPLSKGKGKGK